MAEARAGRRSSSASGKDVLGRALGGELRKARESAGLSRAKVAAATGISEGHIEKIENGRIAEPGVFAVAALARASRTNVDRLVRAAERTVTTKRVRGTEAEAPGEPELG
jgi:transcriptional regulator with XRE-family HTH domain